MFNWEDLWSYIKKNILFVFAAIIIIACSIGFLSQLIQASIDITLSYFEK